MSTELNTPWIDNLENESWVLYEEMRENLQDGGINIPEWHDLPADRRNVLARTIVGNRNMMTKRSQPTLRSMSNDLYSADWTEVADLNEQGLGNTHIDFHIAVGEHSGICAGFRSGLFRTLKLKPVYHLDVQWFVKDGELQFRLKITARDTSVEKVMGSDAWKRKDLSWVRQIIKDSHEYLAYYNLTAENWPEAQMKTISFPLPKPAA